MQVVACNFLATKQQLNCPARTPCNNNNDNKNTQTMSRVRCHGILCVCVCVLQLKSDSYNIHVVPFLVVFVFLSFFRSKHLPNSNSLISLAAWMPSSLRFFSIIFDRATAARSSADDVHPIFNGIVCFLQFSEHEITFLFFQNHKLNYNNELVCVSGLVCGTLFTCSLLILNTVFYGEWKWFK